MGKSFRKELSPGAPDLSPIAPNMAPAKPGALNPTTPRILFYIMQRVN